MATWRQYLVENTIDMKEVDREYKEIKDEQDLVDFVNKWNGIINKSKSLFTNVKSFFANFGNIGGALPTKIVDKNQKIFVKNVQRKIKELRLQEKGKYKEHWNRILDNFEVE
jgi:hypothetical protein